MKGVYYMDLLKWAVFTGIVVYVAFAVFTRVRDTTMVEGPKGLDGIIAGLALVPFFQRKNKKGMVITTSLLTSVVLITIVFFMILGIYFTLTAESGSTSSSFAFGIFDALLRRLPGVG